jgi:hypothetical protein
MASTKRYTYNATAAAPPAPGHAGYVVSIHVLLSESECLRLRDYTDAATDPNSLDAVGEYVRVSRTSTAEVVGRRTLS